LRARSNSPKNGTTVSQSEKSRHLDIGKSEGAVADDQLGVFFISAAEDERDFAVFDAEPNGDDKERWFCRLDEKRNPRET